MTTEIPEPQEHFTREQLFGILNRINFPLDQLPTDTLPPPTLETLKDLHMRIVTSIPFETLSLRTTAARNVDISIEGIYDRVVNQKRGGWCFSLNRLAYELLYGLGYRVQFTIGRITKPLKPDDPPRFSALTHRVSIIRIIDEAAGTDNKYLFDVGFGNSTQVPIQLKDGATVEYNGHIRRMTTKTHMLAQPEILGNQPFVMWSVEEYTPSIDRWLPCYVFSEIQFYENDCFVANYYTSYSPTSTFFKAFWCIRSTMEGDYYMMIDKKFMIKNAKGLVKTIEFHKEQDRLDVLKEYFDIVLTDEELKYHDSWIVEEPESAESKTGRVDPFDADSTVENTTKEVKKIDINKNADAEK
ncbi:N-terminal acetyltransferase [Linnemannia zychae]|nr:N-terminal acetyltransferase [Linnemannia zychae]